MLAWHRLIENLTIRPAYQDLVRELHDGFPASLVAMAVAAAVVTITLIAHWRRPLTPGPRRAIRLLLLGQLLWPWLIVAQETYMAAAATRAVLPAVSPSHRADFLVKNYDLLQATALIFGGATLLLCALTILFWARQKGLNRANRITGGGVV